jgi:hypothetical protein
VTGTVLAEPEAAPAGVLISSPDAVAMAGITFRQLDFWARRDFLRFEQRQSRRGAAGSGCPRSWPAEEVEVARLMGRLTAAGLPLETAHRIARSGEARAEIAPGIVIEVTA